jgi:hypothetical protein
VDAHRRKLIEPHDFDDMNSELNEKDEVYR